MRWRILAAVQALEIGPAQSMLLPHALCLLLPHPPVLPTALALQPPGGHTGHHSALSAPAQVIALLTKRENHCMDISVLRKYALFSQERDNHIEKDAFGNQRLPGGKGLGAG